jgi:hypothetical protein
MALVNVPIVAAVRPVTSFSLQGGAVDGAVPCTEPTDMPWGQRISRMRDCDGVVVEICSPMAVE